MEFEVHDLICEYIEKHNLGVQIGDFSSLLDLFSDDAQLIVRFGHLRTFDGKPAIADAFQTSPPDDELIIKQYSAEENCAMVVYAWKQAPTSMAGSLAFRFANGKITSLLIM